MYASAGRDRSKEGGEGGHGPLTAVPCLSVTRMDSTRKGASPKVRCLKPMLFTKGTFMVFRVCAKISSTMTCKQCHVRARLCHSIIAHVPCVCVRAKPQALHRDLHAAYTAMTEE